MIEFILTIIIGIVIIIIGCFTMKGNVSLIHSYHTKRVKKEDIKRFSKLMGIGTIIVGNGIIIKEILSIINVVNINLNLIHVGDFIMIISLVLGISFMLYALFKYNKGIF